MTATNIVNLTRLSVTYINDEDDIITIPASDNPAKVDSEDVVIGFINGVPIIQTVLEKIIGLPDPRQNTVYIVSPAVAQKVMGRDDVLTPHEDIRDRKGHIVGYKSFRKACMV